MIGKTKNVYATNHEDNKGHKHQFNKKKESEILYGSKREENTLPSYPPHLTIVIWWNHTAFLFPIYGE